MPAGMYHTKEGSGINTNPVKKRVAGRGGLNMQPKRMRKSRRSRRY